MPAEEHQDSTPRDDLDKTVVMQWGEPTPSTSDGPIMHDLVAADIQSRSEFGRNKYGVNLRAFNGRDPLKDAYEEVLDLAVYLRQLMYERDKREAWLGEHDKLAPAVRGERAPVNALATRQLSLFDDPDKTLPLNPVKDKSNAN